MSIQLDDPDVAKGSSTNCMACGIHLSSIGFQHNESDCHTCNLNNKLAGMEPVSAEDIDRVVIASHKQGPTFPPELIEKIAPYSNGYVCCVLGLDLSLPPVRQCMFWSGGPGVALSEILAHGGDLRALFTVRDLVPSCVAIAKAVATKDKRMLQRVLALWDSNISDGGLRLAIEMDLEYAVELIRTTLDDAIRHRNAFYISKGMYDRLDESIPRPFQLVYAVSGDVSRILERCDDEKIRARIVALEGNKERIMEMLDSGGATWNDVHELSRCAPMDIVVEMYNKYKKPDVRHFIDRMSSMEHIMTLDENTLKEFIANGYKPWMNHEIIAKAAVPLVDNGAEEFFLDFLWKTGSRLNTRQITNLIRDVYRSKTSRGWKDIIEFLTGGYISSFAYFLREEVETIMSMVEDGLDLFGGKSLTYRVEYVKKGMEMFGRRILDEEMMTITPFTIDDLMWLMDEKEYALKVQGSCTLVYGSTMYIPEEIDIYVHKEWRSGMEWLSSMDVDLCVMNHPHLSSF